MKQVIQNFRTGELSLADVPAPALRPGGLLVRTRASAISSGTEGTTVRTARRNLVGKAMERPDLVRQVLDVARKEGLSATARKVRARLDTLKGLGYSASGEVVAVAPDVEGFSVGDRVAMAGVGYACHAGINWVPRNLCVRVPDDVDDAAAAFATLGAIALQGVHQADLPFGGSVAVIGLGLIGQLTARLLKAGGAHVIGIDVEPCAVEEALSGGIDQAFCGSGVVERVMGCTRQRGVDAVIVTASSDSGAVMDLAADIIRDRGVVSVVGGVRIDVARSVNSVFYDKEARVVFSRSYGPGRYDPNYEERGFDYPIGHVRWTVARNMELFLDFLERGSLSLEGIITHRFPLERAVEAFDRVAAPDPDDRHLGIVLTYPEEIESVPVSAAMPAIDANESGRRRTVEPPIGVGLVGAGNFARGTLLPAVKGDRRLRLVTVATASGLTAHDAREQFSISRIDGHSDAVISAPDVDTVWILTRHDLHADLAVQALESGKHVFVEKPLAIDRAGLERIEEARGKSDACLMVGYNRRFSEAGVALAEVVSGLKGPFQVDYRINAGAIDRDHWYQDPRIGGGRVIGECGHFVDLLVRTLGSLPVSVSARALADSSGRWLASDNVVATIQFADGSIATLRYLACGDSRAPKERMEVFGDTAVVTLEGQTRLDTFRGGRRTTRKFRSGKGHAEELSAFADAILEGGPGPIPWSELAATSRATFAIVESLAYGGITIPI